LRLHLRDGTDGADALALHENPDVRLDLLGAAVDEAAGFYQDGWSSGRGWCLSYGKPWNGNDKYHSEKAHGRSWPKAGGI